MNSEEFQRNGKELIDFIVEYLDTIQERPVTPNVKPGYLKALIPLDPPKKPESFEQVLNDLEPKILSGMTHWQHPNFHAYFPSRASYPSVLADIISDAIGSIGFSWGSAPSATELERIVLDWLGKMMNLPSGFLSCGENSIGGGCIQTSASECVLVSILAARSQAIQNLKKENPSEDDAVLLTKLVAYCSEEAHSCVEKGAMIAFVKLRILPTDKDFSLRGETLKRAMTEDKEKGLVPFFVSTTIGTTSCCSVDNLQEIGPICSEFGVWLHVDAAYGGGSQICPEFRPHFSGVEHAMSLNLSANKCLLTNFDCSCYWVKDRFKLTSAMGAVHPIYLQNSHSSNDPSLDYRHWGIPLSRRFRSLKLWWVIRCYGVEGLQSYIRGSYRLAKYFEQIVKSDRRFEIVGKVQFGLVCFRFKENDLTKKLLERINQSGKLHMVPANLKGKLVIRFVVCREDATEAQIEYAWSVIQEFADGLDKPLSYCDENNNSREFKKA